MRSTGNRTQGTVLLVCVKLYVTELAVGLPEPIRDTPVGCQAGEGMPGMRTYLVPNRQCPIPDTPSPQTSFSASSWGSATGSGSHSLAHRLPLQLPAAGLPLSRPLLSRWRHDSSPCETPGCCSARQTLCLLHAFLSRSSISIFLS